MNNLTIDDLINKSRLNLNDLCKFDESFTQLAIDLNTNNARQLLWHYTNNTNTKPTCPVCQKQLKWHSDLRKYRSYCSNKCTAIGSVDLAKATSLKKYGVEHYSQTQKFKEAVVNTSLKKYGVEHYSQTQEFKEAVVNTSLKKYNTSHAMQCDSIKEKVKKTIEEKYGVDYLTYMASIRLTGQTTRLKKYNNKNFVNINKRKQTLLAKYGVDHPLKSNVIKNKAVNTRKKNYYPATVLNKLNNPMWLQSQFDSGLTVYQIAEQLNVSSSNLGKYFNQYNINVNIGRNTSQGEYEVVQFLKSLGVNTIITNDRSILNGKELDIVLPDYNLAIEYNGVYWHCESKGKDKHYHYNKTKLCNENDYQLLHILDIDWNDPIKQQIWKSILKSKLRLNSRIYARKCIVKELDTKTAREFFTSNHLNGYVGGHTKLGLFYNNELVQAVVVGIPRFNKKYDNELIRLASKLNTNIIGGASKLLASIKGSIISYADNSYSNGNVYATLGFKKLNTVSFNYYYVKNNVLESRNKFQKHKLNKLLPFFNPNLSEVANMRLNNYDRYWDAGQLTFIKE